MNQDPSVVVGRSSAGRRVVSAASSFLVKISEGARFSATVIRGFVIRSNEKGDFGAFEIKVNVLSPAAETWVCVRRYSDFVWLHSAIGRSTTQAAPRLPRKTFSTRLTDGKSFFVLAGPIEGVLPNLSSHILPASYVS